MARSFFYLGNISDGNQQFEGILDESTIRDL